jgi:hypothetical protein
MKTFRRPCSGAAFSGTQVNLTVTTCRNCRGPQTSHLTVTTCRNCRGPQTSRETAKDVTERRERGYSECRTHRKAKTLIIFPASPYSWGKFVSRVTWLAKTFRRPCSGAAFSGTRVDSPSFVRDPRCVFFAAALTDTDPTLRAQTGRLPGNSQSRFGSGVFKEFSVNWRRAERI